MGTIRTCHKAHSGWGESHPLLSDIQFRAHFQPGWSFREGQPAKRAEIWSDYEGPQAYYDVDVYDGGSISGSCGFVALRYSSTFV